jgi:four helix bundle protein
MTLAERVLQLSDQFPRGEQYGLSQQTRRAAVSIAANIAEGAGQGTPRAVARHLAIARGSLYELDSHLELARRCGWLDEEGLNETIALLRDVLRLVNGLKRWTLRREP